MKLQVVIITFWHHRNRNYAASHIIGLNSVSTFRINRVLGTSHVTMLIVSCSFSLCAWLRYRASLLFCGCRQYRSPMAIQTDQAFPGFPGQASGDTNNDSAAAPTEQTGFFGAGVYRVFFTQDNNG
jgi:hypothetical protein